MTEAASRMVLVVANYGPKSQFRTAILQITIEGRILFSLIFHIKEIKWTLYMAAQKRLPIYYKSHGVEQGYLTMLYLVCFHMTGNHLNYYLLQID